MLDNSAFVIGTCHCPWQAQLRCQGGAMLSRNPGVCFVKMPRVMRAPSPVGAMSGARSRWGRVPERRGGRSGTWPRGGGRTGTGGPGRAHGSGRHDHRASRSALRGPGGPAEAGLAAARPVGRPRAGQRPARAAPGAAGLLHGGGHRRDLAAGDLAVRRETPGYQGRGRLRMGLLVAGPRGGAPEQPVVHPLDRRAFRGPARVPRPDAPRGRADAAGHAGVRPQRLVQSAVDPHARADVLRHVPGGAAVAAHAGRGGLRGRVLRAVLHHGLARLVPAQPGRRGGVPAAGAGGGGAAAPQAGPQAGGAPRRGPRRQPAHRPGVVHPVLIVALAALVPWLVSPSWRQRLAAAVTAAVVSLLVASPQLAAMVAQARSGGAAVPAGTVATDYVFSGTEFPAAPSGLAWAC